jgi:hypothetical protein
MHSSGSGHVHGGRAGRMSFESDFADKIDEVLENTRMEEGLHPSGPLDNPSPLLDAEARDYFRRKADAR